MREKNMREQFISKKNYVYHDHQDADEFVTKVFTDKDRFRMEKEMGDILRDSGLLIPARRAIDEDNFTIIYDYIDGYPIVDLIEIVPLPVAIETMHKICAWMKDFYEIALAARGSQYILGDIHLRNFLYEKKTRQVYGIDFEECRPGRIETDAARLYVFILNYDPPFSVRKKTLAQGLWQTLRESLDLDETFFQKEAARETEEMESRRSHTIQVAGSRF